MPGGDSCVIMTRGTSLISDAKVRVLSFGRTFCAPPRSGYPKPFVFTGTIDSVTVDVSGDLIKDTEAEMRMIMARQ